MNKTMKTLTLSTALLMVVALALAGPVAAQANGCSVGPVAGSCSSGTFTYGGQFPGVDASEAILVHGSVASSISETLFSGYTVTVTCEFTLGELDGCATTYGQWGGPWVGYPVEHTGELLGVALLSVTATY